MLTDPQPGPDVGQGRAGQLEAAHQSAHLHVATLARGVARPVLPVQIDGGGGDAVAIEAVGLGAGWLGAVVVGEFVEALTEAREQVAELEFARADEFAAALEA